MIYEFMIFIELGLFKMVSVLMVQFLRLKVNFIINRSLCQIKNFYFFNDLINLIILGCYVGEQNCVIIRDFLLNCKLIVILEGNVQ